ncbi:MAG TPA: energy-coupling factor transporter transmembrane protein EcfT [Acidimicrobiia bacterium]|jgi:energy-coupling factor transport system ATP-binding protein|nr:energy-coupling factor transporter transmembrane protein EcfT [Acidimicrobiia bacterium]
MTVDAGAGPATRRRRRPELIVLRLLPGHSPVHRLWAGTKLLVVVALAVLVSVRPSWTSLVVAAAFVAVGALAARVPAGAVPRLPRWVFVLLGVNALLTLRAGRPPLVHVGTLALSLGGLEDFLLFTGLAVVLLSAALLVGWTTPLGEVAPALATLAAPLRRLRVPVDEWVVAVGLAIRSLPLLVDEIRTLVAVTRLRRPPRRDRTLSRDRVRAAAREIQGVLGTAVVVALRRARDLADAIDARGGVSARAASSFPRRGDIVVLAATVAVVAAAIVV